MTTKFLPLVAILLLGACSWPADFRTAAIGRHEADIDRCMGIPSHTAETGGLRFVEWDRAAKQSANASLPLGALAALPITLPAQALTGSISLPFSSGDCAVVGTVSGDVVADIHFVGDNDGWRGPNTVCLPEIAECVRSWKREVGR